MAFLYRRKRKGFSKHIAHGLVPAATVAPKPAVPRTPPPRSPSPSPERPRSALAAAILATALTGRTVALPQPQPRQRSLSGSDSICLEQEALEPYATGLGLRQGPDDGCDQSLAQSLEIPASNGEDEDIDACLPDADREAESSPQGSEKKGESFSTNAIYSSPCKKKKEEFAPSPSTNADKEEVPFHETKIQELVAKSNMETEAEDQQTGLNLKEEKSPAQQWMCKKPPLSSDASIWVRQVRETKTKVKFREINQENWALHKALQAIAQELETTKQQNAEQQLQLKTTEQENRRLKEDAEKAHRKEEATELLALGQQAEELVEENDALKMTVHRLNAELSRYQTKFRPLSPAEHRDLKGLPMEGPPPPWLLDMKYLSPLLLAYEDRIKEKENLNIQYEKIMKTFKAQVEELVKENENLHNKLKNDLITTTEWEQLQAQAKLVLKENNMLIQQIEIQQQKEKESNKQHIKKAATLTKQILALESKNQNQEEKLAEYQKQVEALRSTCEELRNKENSKIAAEEHFSLVNDLKSRLQQEQEKRRCEVESLSRQLAELQVQNKQLLLERNNFKADRKILEAEMEMTQKTNRQLQKKIDFLKLQLKEAMQKELTAHYHLRNLISLVEKMAQECDNLFVLSKCLENENHDVLKKIVEGSQRLGKLEEKVKRYKKKATEKLECINLKMTEQEKDFEGKTAQYQQEMKHLQNLLQDKQQTLEEVLQEKRDIEEEREFIWQSTSKENRRIKELLQLSLHRDQQGMECCCSSEPDESAGISLKALTNRHDFSYCEVKPSSRTTNETQEMSGIKAKVCSHIIHGTEPRA